MIQSTFFPVRLRILRRSPAFWLVGVLFASPLYAQWPQWGGADRDFTADTSKLADSWPEGGPKRLWHRTLGTGYSAIVVDDGMLFTMYRKSKPDPYEFTIALDAATGETIWQKRNMAAVPSATEDYGKRFSGPNATPLIVGDRLYTIGRNAKLQCFQKTDGKILWKQDLLKKFGAQIETCGYSPSPIAFHNTIIMPVGLSEKGAHEGNSLVAFDQTTGDVVWQRHKFRLNHSSPVLIKYQGQDQLVLCTKETVIGVAPADGELVWQYTLPTERMEGIFATPVWDGKDTLFFSSREMGCAIRLAKGEGKTTVEPLWSSHKTPLGMGTPVLMDNMLVAAKRGVAPLFMAVDTETGKRLWIKRLFPMATAIGGDGKLIVLDHKGLLALAGVTRDGLTVLSQHQLTEQESFTAPTLVGTTLYVRDEKHIIALDVGGNADRQANVGL